MSKPMLALILALPLFASLSEAKLSPSIGFEKLYEQGLSSVPTTVKSPSESERSVGGLTCSKSAQGYHCSLNRHADHELIFESLNTEIIHRESQQRVRGLRVSFKSIGGIVCFRSPESESLPSQHACLLDSGESEAESISPARALDTLLEKPQAPVERNEERDGGSFPKKSFDNESGSI